MTRSYLLLCGALSSALYVGTDVVGALSYPGYDYLSQAISEMSAIGAPTAPLLAPLYMAYALLFTLFGLGVWLEAGRSRPMRVAAACLVMVGLLGLFVWPFFPMHMRGSNGGLTDTMHLTLGAVDVALLTIAMTAGSGHFGKGFRTYSWTSTAVMLAAGAAAGLYAPAVDADAPTAGLGILERISLGSYLLWVAVLSLKLFRSATGLPSNFEQCDPGGPKDYLLDPQLGHSRSDQARMVS